VFSTREAIVAVHDARVTTPLFRAAAQAVATRARRILVTMDKHVVGVMTGFDFARVVAKGVSA
jgi:hypothetical protein